MWIAKYDGPCAGVESISLPTWREAVGAVCGHINRAAPANTRPSFLADIASVKPDTEWSSTDSVRAFSLRKADEQGWTGRKCPACGGHGEPDQAEQDRTGRRSCVACAGTGEENVCGHAPTPEHIGSGITHCPPAEMTTLPPENVVCLSAITGAVDCDWPSVYDGAEVTDATRPVGKAPELGMGYGSSITPVNEVMPPVHESPVDHTAREHSELGGSITERFWHCPGSVNFVRGAPNPETEASRRGTAAHEVAHMCLVNGQDGVEYIGRTVNKVEIDEPIADGVQAYLDDCRACPADETFYEVRFTLDSLEPPAPMFGTSDYVGYHRATQRLYVKDYKNGFMYVDALGNKQLKYYALGAMLALGDDKPVSDIHITICQPNSLGATLKTDTFDAIDLVEWSQELMAKAHATQAPDAPLVAGPWCDKTFCPRRAECAVHAAFVLANAGAEFDGFDAPIRTPEVRLLTAKQRGAIHGAAEGLRAFLSAVEESIKLDTAGTGWKIVPTRPQEAWLDSDQAAAALQVDHELNPYEPAVVISPATARGMIKDKLHAERMASHTTGKRPTKKAAEDDARVLLAELITKRSGGTKLVPEADPTPGIPTNGAEFDNDQVNQ